MNSNGDKSIIKEYLPFWGDLKKEEQGLVIDNMKSLTFKWGSFLHTGLNCTGLILVKSGQLRVFIISDTGKEITLYRLFDRDICILSASCLFKNINFEVHVEAIEDSEVFLLPTELFQRLSNSNIKVNSFITKLMAAKLSDVMWILEQILFMSFDKRLALYLSEEIAITGSDTIHKTHEEIAKDMGSAREVVSRMLKYFEREGIVTLSRNTIKIIDTQRLLKFT